MTHAPRAPSTVRERADGSTDVSIVIVSFNSADTLEPALRSIDRRADGLNVEAIVVDNASSDDSIAVAKAVRPATRVIESPVNGGYAHGVNLGLRAARGRYLLVLNPDAELRMDTLAEAVAHLDAALGVGVLGCRVRLETGTQQSTLFRLPRLRHLFWNVFVPNALIRRTTWFGDQRYASLSRDHIQDVEVVAGCFMMLPRQVWETVGGMDDRIFLYSEETEWCARIARAGWKIRYNPNVEIMHRGAVSTGGPSPWRNVEMARGQLLFFRFTRGPAIQRAAVAIMLMADVLRAVWFLPLAVIKGRSASEAWRARLLFLAKALADPPKGRVPCPVVAETA